MFETWLRARTAHSVRTQRVDWNTGPPGKKEDSFGISRPIVDREPWFRVKSSIAFQHPSVVLVEKVAVPEDKENAERLWKTEKTMHNGGPGTQATLEKHLHPELGKSSGVLRRLELNTEAFFDFLFSNRWEEGCLLRVLSGRLLDNLLYVLVQLEKFHDVISCVTMAYIHNIHLLQPCIKATEDYKPPTGSDRIKKEKILVELDYICPQERPAELIGEQRLIPERPGKLRFKAPSSFEIFRPNSAPQTHACPAAAEQTEDENEDRSVTPQGSQERSSDGDASTEAPSLSTEPDDKGENASILLKCNICGVTKPAPHKDCLAPYHMVREPLLQRRHREQSVFPPLSVPPVVKHTKYVYVWGDRWQDDDHLGQINEEDKSERVASSTFLERYSDDESANTAKTKTSSKFCQQRQAILAAVEKQNKRSKRRAKASSKPAKGSKGNGKQGNHDVDEDSLDDDDDEEEDEESVSELNIDQDRVRKLEVDIDMMNSELIVQDTAPLVKRTDMKARLKKELLNRKLRRTQYRTAVPPTWCQTKVPPMMSEPEPPTESKDTESKEISSSMSQKNKYKKSKKRAGKNTDSVAQVNKFFQSPHAPLNLMKRWEKCPQFDEFFHYIGPPKTRRSQAKQKTGPIESSSVPIRVDLTKVEEALTEYEKTKACDSKLKTASEETEEADKKEHRKTDVEKGNENEASDPDQVYPPKTDAQGNMILDTVSKQNRSITFAVDLDEDLQLPPHHPQTHITQELDEPAEGIGDQSAAPLRTFFTEGQETLVSNAGLIIGEADPCHISVRIAYLYGDVSKSIGATNDLLRRRERVYRLIKGEKLILQLNCSRLWSLNRKIPVEQRKERSHQEEKTSWEKVTSRSLTPVGKKGTGSQMISRVSHRQEEQQMKERVKRENAYPLDYKRPAGSKVTLSKKTDSSQNIGATVERVKEGDVHEDKGVADEKIFEKSQNKVVLFIDDKDIDDNITEEKLFDLMEVNKYFDIGKLKSTFSFENMFSHSSKPIPNYTKRLKKYQHPLTKKMPRETKTRKSSKQKAKDTRANKAKDKDLKKEEECPPPAAIDDSPAEKLCKLPTVSDKLRVFDFLKHKDHKPCFIDIDKPHHTDFKTEELFDSLLLALQRFVVRKERATLMKPFHSQVSITFTRRPSEAPGFEVPTLLQNSDGQQVAYATCRALLTHLAELSQQQ